MELLYDKENHQNILLEDYGHGLAVQANQYMVVHNGQGIIFDPGGHKVYNQAFSQVASTIRMKDLKYILLSHQDPDIVAALNGWLMTTDATALCSKLWIRFIPHFGVDKYVEHRLVPIPDEGQILDLNGSELYIIPAHFLHSCGNFQVYDPISKILYTGDLGASIGMDYTEVSDFNSHLKYMKGFHQRYMTANIALKSWANMVRQLDIEVIAPQHGALFKGKDLVETFISWCEELECGLDFAASIFNLPKK
ncbi:MAG: MBL fold metallo-hydrolase [Acidobacteria bacterium]|nr:MAG: MBL fold metallo-hydrolase [Acidobacteriota bacterium]